MLPVRPFGPQAVAGHRKQDVDGLVAAAIARFGLDPVAAVGGWGTTLDSVYDALAAELREVVTKIGAALI